MQEIINDIEQFNVNRDWNKYHTPKNLSLAISSEAGELCHEYRWSETPESAENVEYEIADLFILIFTLCYQLGYDEKYIKYIIKDKMKKNAEKYPATFETGTLW
jgi:NTP pyrophosphatase (non-canonical NTP hydrolase)